MLSKSSDEVNQHNPTKGIIKIVVKLLTTTSIRKRKSVTIRFVTRGYDWDNKINFMSDGI